MSKRRRQSLVSALLVAWLLACTSVPAPKQVKYLDTRRREAMVYADVAALRELMADGLLYGHANGEVHSKEDLLELLASGELDYRSIAVEALEVRELAGVWVLTGRQSIELTWAGTPVESESVFTAVYAKQGGQLRLVAYQSTPAD